MIARQWEAFGMSKKSGDDWLLNEGEYLEYLEAERHLFAWCLVRLGSYSPQAAAQKALERYPYEAPDEPFRGFVFHDISWTWAMIQLFGHNHGEWPSVDPAVRAEFEREADRWHRRV